VGVVTGGDEVYHHSFSRVIAKGVCTHLNVRGPFLPLRRGEKPCLSMAGVLGVRQLGPCTRVRLLPPGRRRTDLFHGAPRKMHWGDARGWLLFVTAETHSLGGGGGQHRGR
jgi:hypothetical protein